MRRARKLHRLDRSRAELDAINDYVRSQLRENGALRRLFPELAVDVVAEGGGRYRAFTVPGAGLPLNGVVYGERYEVPTIAIDRPVTPTDQPPTS